MEELRSKIEEIRLLEGVRPGDPMRGNQDQGHLGQTIDNLTHTDENADAYGAWKEVKESEGFRAQVVETANTYIAWLKKSKSLRGRAAKAAEGWWWQFRYWLRKKRSEIEKKRTS